MTLVVGDVIAAARDADQAFHPSRVPNPTLVRYLSRYQRQLIGRAHEIRPGLVSSQLSVVIASTLSGVGVFQTGGAGTGDGFPDASSSAAVPPYGPQAFASFAPLVGSTFELDIQHATPLWPSTVVNASTPASVTSTNANWTINQFVNQLLVITIGTDFQDQRLIVGNTANTITVSAPFTTQPDTTSIFAVFSVNPVISQETAIALGMPALGRRYGYSVKFDGNGTPYLDLTAPLVGLYEQGIPLPWHKALLDGVVYFNTSANSQDVMPLTIVDRSHRTKAWGNFACWTDDTSLFLIGRKEDWNQVGSLDIRYVPEPGDMTQLTDAFVLPDHAQPVLICAAALFAAKRCSSLKDSPPVDVGMYQRDLAQAESLWLNELGTRFRAQTSYTNEVW